MIADLLHPRTWIVLAIAFILALWMMGISILDIPKTIHAGTAHADQKWNAASIQMTMSKGDCGEVQVFTCSDDTTIYTCQSPSDPKKLLGLVVGSTDQQVITGYTARANHWTGKTDSCSLSGSFVTP